MRRLLAVILLVALLATPAVTSACPGCKEALFDPDQLAQKLSTARGYALSIGLLLTVPFLIIAGFAAFIIGSARRTKRSERSSVDTPALSR